MKSLIWLRRSLFVVLWCAAVLIAAKLTTMPVHADDISYKCTRCSYATHSLPPDADPSKTRVEITDDYHRDCVESDKIPPAHCCYVNYKFYEYYNSDGGFIGSEYEEDCLHPTVTTTTCPFYLPPSPPPTPTP